MPALRARSTHLTVEFRTVHGSKGKEADYVVVLGLERAAFPDNRQDDPVLQLAIAAPDAYPHAEERRLFYVALTCARRSVLLLTRAGRESPFLIELARDHGVAVRSSDGAGATITVCPKCRTRSMAERTGRYASSNSKTLQWPTTHLETSVLQRWELQARSQHVDLIWYRLSRPDGQE